MCDSARKISDPEYTRLCPHIRGKLIDIARVIAEILGAIYPYITSWNAIIKT